MKLLSLAEELKSNSYPGRGRHGRSKDGTKAVTAYFIMGRSENSRNRVFVEEGRGDPHPRPSIRQSFLIPALSSMRRSVSWAIRPS